ncbi:MAG: hypothetical protein Q8S35_01135 [bacterium]|nr:hypothetical protein [bacterium]
MKTAVWRISGTALLLSLPELDIERTVWIDYVSEDRVVFRTQHPFELDDDVVTIEYRGHSSKAKGPALYDGLIYQPLYLAMRQFALAIMAGIRGVGSRATINLAGSTTHVYQITRDLVELSILKHPQLHARIRRGSTTPREDMREVWCAHLADILWSAMKTPVQGELALAG